MNAPLLTEHISVERTPIFIADPRGLFASDIASFLTQGFLPVILTRRTETKQENHTAIVIPYRTRIPKIPDNNFCSIYYIDGEEKSSPTLFQILLAEAKRRKIPFYFVASRRFYAKKHVQQVLGFELGSVYLYGDIIDDPVFINPAANIVGHAKEKQEIVLANQGLGKIFPVSRQFVVESLLRYSVVEQGQHPCVVLAPSGEIYELSLARILQQLSPELLLHFSHHKGTTNPIADLPEGSVVVSEQDVSLKNALRKELGVFREKQHSKRSSPPQIAPALRFIYRGLFSVVTLIALLFFLTGGMAFFGERLLVRSLRFASEMRFSEAKQQAVLAKSAFAVSSFSLRALKPVVKAMLIERPVVSLEKKLFSGEKAAGLIQEVSDGATVFWTLFMSREKISKERLVEATQRIKNSFLLLSQLIAEGEVPDEHVKSISENKKSINLFLATSDIVPDLLGFGGEKKYLLLFQNNNELRPGGGFIGSFAVLRVKDGKFGEMKIQDVYDADGQLKGHVEPPRALKKYLGASHWYLRDSNFSPDFPESGANAAFFLNLETGDRADGVIAIDTSVLEGLLRAVGPIRLQGSQKEVNAENVVALTQAGVEKDFFPGSTQKKDFLNELYGAIRNKMGERGVGSLLRLTSSGLLQKHILVTFVDPKLSLPFLLQGVSSTLQTSKEGEGVMGFFGVSEANVGANKVNKYIERSLLYDVSVTEKNEVKTQITETLENKSEGDALYGGEYKVYLRFIVPEDVSPEEILIDGVKQVVLAPLENQASIDARGAIAENTLEVERIDIKGKSTYGFFLTIPVHAKRTIVMKYVQLASTSSPLEKYTLTLFKQPGTGPDPYMFSLSLPSKYTLFSSSVPLKKEGSLYRYISRLGTDQEIRLSYGKR